MKTYQPTNRNKITIPKPRRGRKFLIILLLLAAIGAGIWWWTQKGEQASEELKPEEVKAFSINGNLVEKSKAESRPMAVVIENSPEARPQSGLTDAEIVYETVAEGGITRFLTVFQTREPKEIGPVRSARPYFNSLANMWGAALVHSGGSKQALSELDSGMHENLYDVNEFYYGKYFSRDKSRSAPHNLYTTTQQLTDLLSAKEERGWIPKAMWEFEAVPTEQISQDITNITIPFSFPIFEAKYKFDPTTNSYLRSINNQPHKDRNNGLQISPKNVVVMLTDITPTGDELLTMNVRLNGNGPCYLFTAGKFKECRWRFENERHYYTDTEGNPLKLQPGQTWVEIFPRDKQSELTWN